MANLPTFLIAGVPKVLCKILIEKFSALIDRDLSAWQS